VSGLGQKLAYSACAISKPCSAFFANCTLAQIVKSLSTDGYTKLCICDCGKDAWIPVFNIRICIRQELSVSVSYPFRRC